MGVTKISFLCIVGEACRKCLRVGHFARVCRAGVSKIGAINEQCGPEGDDDQKVVLLQ